VEREEGKQMSYDFQGLLEPMVLILTRKKGALSSTKGLSLKNESNYNPENKICLNTDLSLLKCSVWSPLYYLHRRHICICLSAAQLPPLSSIAFHPAPQNYLFESAD
jgi:hypothetical protein